MMFRLILLLELAVEMYSFSAVVLHSPRTPTPRSWLGRLNQEPTYHCVHSTSAIDKQTRKFQSALSSTTAIANSTFLDTCCRQPANEAAYSTTRYRRHGNLDDLQTNLLDATVGLVSHPQSKPAIVPWLSQVNQARLLVLGAAALYGTNFSLVKLLGDSLPPGSSSALRFGMAALVTLPWLIYDPQPDDNGVQVLDRDSAMAATLAGFEVGLWNSIGYVTQTVGLATTAATKSAFLCSIAVAVVPVLDWLTGKEIKFRQIMGVVLALVGVGFLELAGCADCTWDANDIASIVQPLFFGVGFWKMEKSMHNHPNQALRSTAAQLMAIFLASCAYCAFANEATTWLDLTSWLTDPAILGALCWTGVVTTALTIYMETAALKTLSAAETTLMFSTEPLWGTAFAAVVMGEHLGLDAGVGAFFILAGCLVSTLESLAADTRAAS